MKRKSPLKGHAASASLPPQQFSTGPSRKPAQPAVKAPAKKNLSERVKRTSDTPKVDGGA